MTGTIAVLDYGIGNLRSAQKALERLGASAVLTDDATVVDRAAGVVLPGVGAFGACMTALKASGLDTAVFEAVGAGKPFLGICVGMQMLFEGSEEDPHVPGLGILSGSVCRLEPPAGGKLPHMGWNTVEVSERSRLLSGLGGAGGSWMYFVHSYAPVPSDPAMVTGWTDYGGPVVAALERGTVWATQFHPEKSSTGGMRVLGNFVAACSAS